MARAPASDHTTEVHISTMLPHCRITNEARCLFGIPAEMGVGRYTSLGSTIVQETSWHAIRYGVRYGSTNDNDLVRTCIPAKSNHSSTSIPQESLTYSALTNAQKPVARPFPGPNNHAVFDAIKGTGNSSLLAYEVLSRRVVHRF